MNQTAQDIAKSLTNEATQLETLEHIWEVAGETQDSVSKANTDAEKLAHYAAALKQIRSVISICNQYCAIDPNGEVDRTQEYEEDKLSNSWNS